MSAASVRRCTFDRATLSCLARALVPQKRSEMHHTGKGSEEGAVDKSGRSQPKAAISQPCHILVTRHQCDPSGVSNRLKKVYTFSRCATKIATSHLPTCCPSLHRVGLPTDVHAISATERLVAAG